MASCKDCKSRSELRKSSKYGLLKPDCRRKSESLLSNSSMLSESQSSAVCLEYLIDFMMSGRDYCGLTIDEYALQIVNRKSSMGSVPLLSILAHVFEVGLA